MSSPNNAYKTYRNLSTTGATSAETGILSCAVGMHRGGGVQLLGTFSATVQFEETLDGGTTWIAKTVYPVGGGVGVTSAAGTGQWKFANGGSTNFRVRCSAFTSGPVAVALTLTEGVDPVALPVTLNGAMGVTPSLGGMALLGNGRLSGTVTIANAASLSGAIDLGSSSLAGILMPATWTTAGLSFAVSTSLAGTYVPLWNIAGSEYIVPSTSAVASQFVTLPRADFLGIQYLKVRSGTAGSPVAQGAARDLILISVP